MISRDDTAPQNLGTITETNGSGYAAGHASVWT